MNKFLGLLRKNSKYLIIGSIILAAAIVLVLIVADKGKDKNKATDVNNSLNSSENVSSDKASTDSNSATSSESQPNSDEIGDEIPDDETTADPEKETEPETTKKPIDYKYSIRVNTYTNCVTIYTKDADGKFTVPYKAMACSTGKGNNATKSGKWNTLKYYKWCRMVDWTYSQYSYRIHGSIMFHSTPCALNLTLNGAVPSPYYSKGRVEVEEFNKLGSVASLGCIRLTVADAKWICDNCPSGTQTVIVHETTDPLPKPEVIKIPEVIPAECGGWVDTLMPENHRVSPINWVYKKIYVAWDPTDPDPNNPWHKYTATISCEDTLTVASGFTEDAILNQITAKDTCGNIINNKVKITGTYDLNTIGSYKITLSVTDALGRSAEKTVTLEVVKELPTGPDTTVDNPETSSDELQSTTTVGEESTSESDTTILGGETTESESTTVSDDVTSESDSTTILEDVTTTISDSTTAASDTTDVSDETTTSDEAKTPDATTVSDTTTVIEDITTTEPETTTVANENITT